MIVCVLIFLFNTWYNANALLFKPKIFAFVITIFILTGASACMYFVRWIAVKAFYGQLSAEHSHNSLVNVFDILPDGVFVLTEKQEGAVSESNVIASQIEILQDNAIHMG